MKSPRGWNTWKKLAALLAVLIFLGAGGTYLGFQLIKPSVAVQHKLTTTPDCLSAQSLKKGSFCTGVALRAVNRKVLATFTKESGVFPSMVEYYQAFGKGFSLTTAKTVAYVGSRPFVQLNPHNISMAAITAGKYDNYLETFARSVKAFGHQVVLSFGHEMNGDWSTWSLPFTKPKDFRAAWIHIHNIFTQQKVKNVTWAWDISHLSKQAKPAKRWWPGSQYVDWVGIDGYLRPGQTFAGQFLKTLAYVRRFDDHKPILITETAVEPGKQQTAQIASLFAGAHRTHMMGLVWFDVNRLEKWNLETNPAALAAFKKAESSVSGA